MLAGGWHDWSGSEITEISHVQSIIREIYYLCALEGGVWCLRGCLLLNNIVAGHDPMFFFIKLDPEPDLPLHWPVNSATHQCITFRS